MQFYDKPAKPIRDVEGYESGIDYKKIASTMPYMYTDEPERIQFITSVGIIDQVIDWFGKDIKIENTENENEVLVSLSASPYAMEHWAMQYLNHVEVIAPEHLRTRIAASLKNGLEKYNG
jgi:predicted DNA-binding transcriptional regulator YafY